MTALKPRNPGLREQLRGVTTLLTGSVGAQAIPVLASFALTRIYPDTAFGVFTVFQSALALLTTVSTGRFEAAILIPRSRRAAAKFAAACIASSTIASAAVTCTMLLAGPWLEARLDAPALASIAPLLGPSLLLADLGLVASRWGSRGRRWASLAWAQVAGAASRAVLTIAAGIVWQTAEAMVFAAMAGAAMSLLVARPPVGEAMAVLRATPRRTALVRLLWEHRQFPLYSVPAGILEVAARESVVGVMIAAFGASTVGMLGLAQRTMRIPVQALSASMGQVFRQTAAERLARGEDCRPLLLKTSATLAALASPVFAAVMLFGPELFAALFGADWREAGRLARALVPMCFLSLTVGTVSNVLMLAGWQRFDFLNQAWLAVAATAAAWGAARSSGDPVMAVHAYGAFYSAKYLVEFGACVRACAPPRPERP
jgi:O-antigen/teichoic acid export membrane protein